MQESEKEWFLAIRMFERIRSEDIVLKIHSGGWPSFLQRFCCPKNILLCSGALDSILDNKMQESEKEGFPFSFFQKS
jgi:hypothetical protein